MNLTPAQVGRRHALERLAEAAKALAEARPLPPYLDDDDRAYLASYAETCRNVAGRLTASAEATR